MIVSDARVAAFAERKLGQDLCRPFSVIGWQSNGRVVAALAFSCWTGADIHLTVAAEKGRMTRALFRAGSDYVFRQLGCARATIITESEEVADYGERLGAEREGVSRNQFGEGRHGFRLAFHRDGRRF